MTQEFITDMNFQVQTVKGHKSSLCGPSISIPGTGAQKAGGVEQSGGPSSHWRL
jgi:hypothetical protein